jgi:hypothetical protein
MITCCAADGLGRVEGLDNLLRVPGAGFVLGGDMHARGLPSFAWLVGPG